MRGKVADKADERVRLTNEAVAGESTYLIKQRPTWYKSKTTLCAPSLKKVIFIPLISGTGKSQSMHFYMTFNCLGMRLVKMNCWETSFLKRIKTIRDKETAWIILYSVVKGSDLHLIGPYRIK